MILSFPAHGARRSFLISEGRVFAQAAALGPGMQLPLQLLCIVVSAALYFSFFRMNSYAFQMFELHAGANWVFLPAGLRLLCTLVFGGAGAIGLWIASLLIVVSDFIEVDTITALVSSVISAGAPYLAYRLALRAGMPDTLVQLTPKRLMQLSIAYAFANALLHSAWYALRDIHPDFIGGFVTMFVGDLIGTLVVLYAMKTLLAVFRALKLRRAQPAGHADADDDAIEPRKSSKDLSEPGHD